MKRQLLSFFFVLLVGVIMGIFITGKKNTENNIEADDPIIITDDQNYNEYLVHQDDIQILHNRMTVLEKSISNLELKLENIEPVPAIISSQVKSNSRKTRSLTTISLIDAGINEQLATEIIRKQDAHDYKILDLKDRAIRGGYSHTTRYRKELRALKNQASNLREELGDDIYDRYLYASGRPNRVSIISVMLGSPAEQAGLETGDFILSYADKNIFQWNEINKETAKGLRDEIVIITVIRNGEILNLAVARGPLGVKLKPDTGEPLGTIFY